MTQLEAFLDELEKRGGLGDLASSTMEALKKKYQSQVGKTEWLKKIRAQQNMMGVRATRINPLHL